MSPMIAAATILIWLLVSDRAASSCANMGLSSGRRFFPVIESGLFDPNVVVGPCRLIWGDRSSQPQSSSATLMHPPLPPNLINEASLRLIDITWDSST